MDAHDVAAGGEWKLLRLRPRGAWMDEPVKLPAPGVIRIIAEKNIVATCKFEVFTGKKDLQVKNS